jgi:hypothetical protein
LPILDKANTVVDGTTQTVNVGNTDPVMLGSGGTVGVDMLALQQVPGPEAQIVISSPAFRVQAGDIGIRGFAITGVSGGGAIEISAASDTCFIELNVLGSAATTFADPGAPARNQLNISSSGGTNALVRNNLIGFAANTAISLSGGSNGWKILHNQFLDNGLSTTNGDGIIITGCVDELIDQNRIAGTSTQGIIMNTVSDAMISNNTISGNGCGHNIHGSERRRHRSDRMQQHPLRSEHHGCQLRRRGPGEQWSTGIEMTRNNFHDNGTITARNGAAATGQIGIDLNSGSDNAEFGTPPFYTLNDAGDGDDGANGLQNFPVLASAGTSMGNTAITGALNSAPGTPYRIEFFSNVNGDPSGYGEGQTYLGSTTVTTDALGMASINAFLPGISLTAGHRVSATATSTVLHSTSEFLRPSNSIRSSCDSSRPAHAPQHVSRHHFASFHDNRSPPRRTADVTNHIRF